MTFLRKLHLQGLLSFPPVMEPIELQPLNVLIGPNGAGKTNLIETLELLRATPTDFASAIRAGGRHCGMAVERREPGRQGDDKCRNR